MDEPHGPRRAAAMAARAMNDDEPETLSAHEKYKRVAEHRRYPKKNRYNLEDLALGLTASDAGVNRYYAMHAGPVAKKTLHYLAQAAGARKPEVKSKSLRLARKYFTDISAERHPELTEQIEARLLWEEGHRPETYEAKPSVNPETGAQEFFGIRDAFDKVTGGLFGNDRMRTPPIVAPPPPSPPPPSDAIVLQQLNDPSIGTKIPRETLILPTEKPEPPPLKSRTAVRVNLPGEGIQNFLDAEFAKKVDNFRRYAIEQGETLDFLSVYRPPDQQKKLLNDPTAVTPAKNSLHSAGLAFDLNGFKYLPPERRQRILDAARAAGLSWGGNFSDPDPDHFYFDPGGDRRKLITDFGEQVKRLQPEK